MIRTRAKAKATGKAADVAAEPRSPGRKPTKPREYAAEAKAFSEALAAVLGPGALAALRDTLGYHHSTMMRYSAGNIPPSSELWMVLELLANLPATKRRALIRSGSDPLTGPGDKTRALLKALQGSANDDRAPRNARA